MVVNAIVTLVILLIGTISNAVVIYTYFKVKSLHTINNIFLCQLAFVDMTKASLILPFKVYFQFKASQLSNRYICQLTAFISSFTYLHSSALLAMIAVVRYFKLLRPFNFGHVFSKRNVAICSVLLILVSGVVSLLPVIGLGRYQFSTYHGICFADWSSINSLYRIFFYLLTIGLNYPVLIISYGKIFLALRKHGRSIKSVANAAITSISKCSVKQDEASCPKVKHDALENGEELLDISDVDGERIVRVHAISNTSTRVRFWTKAKVEEKHIETVHKDSHGTLSEGKIDGNSPEKSHRHECRRFNREVEVTKAMFTMFIAYSFCWLPAFFVNLFMLTKLVDVAPSALFIIVTLVELKVCLNPLVYVTWSSQFRKALKQVFSTDVRAARMEK